jgi:uncharacterized SAM-binding protein YcdF (DUF218 family)
MTSPQASKTRVAAPLLQSARLLLRALGVFAVIIIGGFVWFLAQLRSDEAPPKNPADGIVVLTGGSSRVSDAVDLLANGYGKRLLISGVHWSTGTGELSRCATATHGSPVASISIIRRSIPVAMRTRRAAGCTSAASAP